jgi:hypothetical protein
VVILAEDNDIREKLRQHDIIVQTIDEVTPVEVQPARVLSHLYTYLGKFDRFLYSDNFRNCFPYCVLQDSSEVI